LTRRRNGRTSNTAAAPSANGHISSIADPLWLILRAVAPRDTARRGIDSPAGEPEKRWERETPHEPAGSARLIVDHERASEP
jgi:hypothetical protein